MGHHSENSLLKPMDFAVTLLALLEHKRPPTFFLKLLSSLAVLLYFGQMLSYLVNPDVDNVEDVKLWFLRKALFYCNYINFLCYFQRDWLTTLVLYLCYILSFGFPIYIIFRTFIGKKQKSFYNANISLFSGIESLMAEILAFYPWAIQVPMFELFINVLECDSDSFYEAARTSCPPTSAPLLVFSILSCFFNVTLGLLIVMLFQNCEFFHTGATIPMKSENSSIFAVIYLLKCLLPLGHPILRNYQTIYYVLLAAIIVLSLLDFSRRPPFRERWISRIFVSSLMFTIAIVLVSFFSVFTSLVVPSSFIYIVSILILILMKTGLTLCNHLYFGRILHDFTDIHLLDFLAEEVLILQYRAELSRKDRLYCLGILRKHARLCLNAECKLRQKHLMAMEAADSQALLKRVNGFLAQSFGLKLRAIVRKNEPPQLYESLLLKYVSFLINSRFTGLKAFYELQRFRSWAPKPVSFNFRVMAKLLKREIKQRLDRVELERALKSENKHLNEMKVSDFFKVDAEKRLMEKKTKKLLADKLRFWERFKDGFKSYEELIAGVYSLIDRIRDFQRLLKHSLQPNGVIALKFNSILHSLLLNSINEAIKFEDEIDNFKKRCFNIDRETITNLSFFDRDFAVCQVSLLNLKGQLMEAGKTPRLAQIFGYQLIDLKNVNFITQLMPPVIAAKHEQMILKTLNRDASDMGLAKKTITSFALDRKGHIFKIRVFFTQSYQHQTDFLMNAAIMRVEEKSKRPQLIFDGQGVIQGMNEDFFTFIKQETTETIKDSSLKGHNTNNEISLLDYNLLNMFVLMPKIKDILTENEVYKDRESQTIRNETAILDIPENLKDIIEKLKARKKDAELSDRSGGNSLSRFTMNSVRTARSKTSNHNNKNNKPYSKDALTGTATTLMSPEQIMIQNAGEMKKFRVSFDLLVQNFSYGKGTEESIIIINLHVMKLQALRKDIARAGTDLRDPKDLYHESLVKTIMNNPKPKQMEVTVKNSLPIPPMTKRNTVRETEGDETVNENPSSFVKLPPDNSIAFHDFGRKVNEDLPLEDEKRLNEQFLTAVLPQNTPNSNNKDLEIQIQKDNAAPLVQLKNSALINAQNDNTSDSHDPEPLATEKLDLPDLLEKQSQKASSITSMKRTFGIFATIKSIQERVPLSIRQFTAVSFLELLVITVYCVFLYYVGISYISGSYLPLQLSMINFCRSSVDFNFGVLSISQYEYWYYNYSTTKINGSAWNEYNAIIKNSVIEGSNVLYDEMNKPLVFSYQSVIETRTRTFIDYLTKQVSNITYMPMFQFFLDVLNEFDGATPTQIFNNSKYINVLQRNYYYFYQINNQIITSIQTDFQNSNGTVTSQFQNLLIVLITIFAVAGLIKLLHFSLYNVRIMKILNIILRMQSMQIFNEIALYKEMLKLFEDPFDSYLNIYFTEKVINSKNILLDETKEAVMNFDKANANVKTKKFASKNKNKMKQSVKKTSILNIKPLSKLRPLVFLSVIFAVSFAYLYSNFFMWTNTNNTINDLINININFNKLYYYSAFLLLANNMMLREKIIRDPAYENSGEPTQTMDSRLSSFNRSYIARLVDFNNYISSISKYGVGIQDDYNNDEYNNILSGDICTVLDKNKMVNAYELKYCKTGLNNAFLQGLPGLLNEFRNNLLSYANMTNLVPKNDTLNNKIQIALIKKFISGKNQTDINMGGYLVCKSVLIFYNKVNDYYYHILNENINAFLVFLVITSCFCAFFFALGAILGYKYLRQIYCNVCWSLMLIPYEKLINDEQISFLIKQIAKDK